MSRDEIEAHQQTQRVHKAKMAEKDSRVLNSVWLQTFSYPSMHQGNVRPRFFQIITKQTNATYEK